MKLLYTTFLLAAFFIITGCGTDDSPKGDTEDPSTPLNLMSTSATDTSIELTWQAATDNVGVTGYNLYQDGSVTQSNISATSVSITGLIANTPYMFQVTAVDAAGNESSLSNTVTVNTAAEPLEFLQNLSEMGVFAGTLSDLEPAAGVQLYEINSTLFTDYASKQRLVRLPEGSSMMFNNSDLLPDFPDNTLIAKTFYYNIDDRDLSLGKQIIETRIFLKISGAWEASDYVWNSTQTDATLQNNGGLVPISYIDMEGTSQNVDYVIPSQTDCRTCHNNNGRTFPIGMKLRSMNFVPSYTNMNQIDHFKSKGILNGLGNSGDISVLPDWTDDVTYSILERGRAYIDVNCAHCHQPGGEVTNFSLDFRYETPFAETAIYANRGEIEARIQSTLPTYRMPQLGRTIVHEEAVSMLLEYLEAIED